MIGITNAVSSIIGRIVVSYPVGSICTCTNEYDTVTYTAKDTSGACVFNIMSLGTWTVSCTTGGSDPSTTSANVVIDKWWQTKNVALSYEAILIESGIPQVEFVVSQYGTLTPGSQSQAYATFSTSGNYAVIARTKDKIDITSFDTLTMTLDASNANYCYINTDNCPVIGIASNVPEIGASSATLDSVDAVENISTAYYWTGGTTQLDLSGYTGEKYVFVTISGSQSYSGLLNIAEFYAI